MTDTRAAGPTVAAYTPPSGAALALTLAGLMTTLFLAVLDGTVVGTALPRIVAELDGFDRYSWVATAYLLSSTVMIPIVSKLSDIFGRKRQLIITLVGFVGGSALCGFAQTMDQLIAFRFIQGLAGGGLISLVFASVADLFTPAERGKWNGLFFGMITLASVIGPPVGGLITENISWRWVFYINVPLCLAALVVLGHGLRARGPKPGASWRGIDYKGGGALTVALFTLLLAVIAGETDFNWLAPVPLALIVVAVVAFVIFLRIERHVDDPMVPLSLFRSPIVRFGSMIAFLTSAAFLARGLYGPLYLQTVVGDTPTIAGLTTMPDILAGLVANVLTGQLVSRTARYKPIMRVGSILMPLGLGMFVLLAGQGERWIYIVSMVIFSIGFSMVAPALNVGMQNAYPPQMMGAGTGTNILIRSIGQIISTALVGSVIVATFVTTLPARMPPEAAQLDQRVVAELTDPTTFLVRGSHRERSPIDAAQQPIVDQVNRAVNQSIAAGVSLAFSGLLVASILAGLLVWFAIPEGRLRRTRDAG